MPAASSELAHRVGWGARLATKVLAALLSLAVVLTSYWAWSTWNQFQRDVKVGAPIQPLAPSGSGSKTAADPDGPDQNILVLGNDSRAGATAKELADLGTADDGGSANTDTMMLLHVPGNGKKASIVSFPRDSYVAIPGHGMQKLNAAYPDGYFPVKNSGGQELDAQSAGVNLLAQTLQQLTGLKIDHYLQVNLLGFYRISKAIGGVPVLLCQPQNRQTDSDAYGSGYSGIDLPAGLSKISGKQAMAFVRQRHGLNSDLDRINRQQYFLKSAFHQMLSAGTLLNVFEVQNLLKAVSSSLFKDPSLDLLKLASTFADLAESNLVTKTIPVDDFGFRDIDGQNQSVVLITPAKVRSFVTALFGPPASKPLAGVPTVNPASFTVTVLNAAGVSGIAGRNADKLTAAGFHAVAGDSSAGTSPTTTISYPAGMEAQAKTLSAQVPGATLTRSDQASGVTLTLGTDGIEVAGTSGAAKTTPPAGRSSTSTATVPIGTGKPNGPNQPGCIQ